MTAAILKDKHEADRKSFTHIASFCFIYKIPTAKQIDRLCGCVVILILFVLGKPVKKIDAVLAICLFNKTFMNVFAE